MSVLGVQAWKRWKPRERALGVSTLVVGALCLFYRAAFVPAVERLDGIYQEIHIHLKQLAADRRMVAQREEVSRVYSRYAHLVQAVGSDEEETSRLLGEVASLARLAEVTVVNLKPRPMETAGLAKLYQVEVETESSLAGLARFLYDVERSPQLLSVARLEARQEEKLQSPLRCAIRISKIVIP